MAIEDIREEGGEKQEQIYKPSVKEVATINRVFERFQRMKEERDKTRREFDGLTITQYVTNSMDAYNGIVSDALKETKEDWQSIIWDHKTRGKVKAVLSMIVGMRPFVSMIGKTKESNKYAADLAEVYEDSWKNENGAYKLYLQAFSACNKGTVIVNELYNEQKVKRKEITSVDQETGKVNFKEKKVIKGGYGHCEAEIVNLLKFYPNENSAEIEHDCCVTEFYSKTSFRNKFKKFPNYEFVSPGIWANTALDDIEYQSITSRRDELVEVIKYYNEDLDEFIILANGFWLNPQDGDEASPIPFNHKKLPYSKTVFELADEECFYGKSLPDLMKGEQDPDNALLRLMIDQEILAVNKPILLGMGNEIESYELYPGKTIKMPGDINQVKEMDMSGASQSGFQLLNLLKQNADTNTALDPISQGVSSGGRKTARESVILDENSKKSAGPFQLNIYKLLLDRAKLRVENIKQFYTKPIQYNALKDKYGKEVTNSKGKKAKGAKQYREITVAKPGSEPKWITVKPEIAAADFEIRFIEDFEVTDNRSSRIEMAKALLDEAKANPLISADEATIDYLEAIRRNPDRFYIKPTEEAKAFQTDAGVPPVNPPQEEV